VPAAPGGRWTGAPVSSRDRARGIAKPTRNLQDALDLDILIETTDTPESIAFNDISGKKD
jgi:hypothetical protein